MTLTAEKTDFKNPLDHLSAMLEDDMDQVNAQIIKHMQSPVALIPQLAGYLIAAGGKRVRPLLTLAATSLYGGDMQRAAGLAACVEFIHSATLLHDDVVDESDQRRGKDAANTVFGNQASVLVGDFLFSRSFQLMTADGSLDVLKILSDASAIIAEGEVLQLANTGKLSVTMDDYIAVIEAKTAALFAASCEVGPVIAGADETARNAMADYGRNLGIAFQIADDILDYSAAREKLGKTIGDDFREGKITAPVLFALENATTEEQDFWTRTFAEHNQKDGDLDHAMSLIQKYDGINKSISLARTYQQKGVDALNKAPENLIKPILRDLLAYVVDREF